MAGDLPSGQRMWELAREAIEFEVIPHYEQYKTAEAISKLDPVEKRFFIACLDYDGAVAYKEAVEDWRVGYDPFERNDMQFLNRPRLVWSQKYAKSLEHRLAELAEKTRPQVFKLDSTPDYFVDPVEKAISRKLVEQLQRGRAADPEQIYRRCRRDFGEHVEDMQR